MKKYLLFFGMGLFLLGCSNFQEKEYEGTYTEGFEVEIFTDVDTGQNYWLTGKKKVLEPLYDKMKKLKATAEESYPEINVKFKGIDRGKATNGLAEENDRLLEVTEIEHF
ncbi:MAG: hypothetical protein ACRC0W_01530 [Cetobacterium sp.]